MQTQRLKALVFPARRGKRSFGTDGDHTVSASRQGSLLHCSERFAGAFLSLPNDNEAQNKMFPHTVLCALLRPEGQIQATGDTLLAHGGIRTREKSALQAQGARVLPAYTSEPPGAPL